MNWRSLGVAAMVIGSTVLATPPILAGGKVVQDAHCSGNSGGSYTLGSQAYSEAFIAGHTGKLTRGFIETYNLLNFPATYKVELWTADDFGLPTGTAPLASTTVEHPAYGYHFDYPTFPTPATVAKGHKYALVVTVPNANNNGVLVDPNNPCPGTFASSSNGSIGGFQPDQQNRDMEYSVSIQIKRRHKH